MDTLSGQDSRPQLHSITGCLLIIIIILIITRTAVLYYNFQVGSAFPVQVCTLPNSVDRTSATRLTRSDFMLHIG